MSTSDTRPEGDDTPPGERGGTALPGGAFLASGHGDELVTGARRPPAPGRRPPASRRRRGPLRNLIEWLVVIGGALAVALVIKTFLFQAFYIPSESMEPTLTDGDRVLVNKLSYDIDDLSRGDVIVFERPPNEPPDEIDDLIKRVIGLPGEVVEGIDGRVVVDGVALDEDYLGPGVATHPFAPILVPEGRLFVMGDNRGNSRDSRFFGPIDDDLIVGRAFVKVWPIGRVGWL
ncbi:MAG: signal peptidase I [Acidimicrobiia bacterium]|nr:signal peptidase I [Acidimicrobiia bacterium]